MKSRYWYGVANSIVIGMKIHTIGLAGMAKLVEIENKVDLDCVKTHLDCFCFNVFVLELSKIISD